MWRHNQINFGFIIDEFTAIAQRIMRQTTRDNVVAKSKEMYRLKLKYFPLMHTASWRILSECCPLCSVYAGATGGDCKQCPLFSGVDDTGERLKDCCDEWQDLEYHVSISMPLQAMESLKMLAERIFNLEEK